MLQRYQTDDCALQSTSGFSSNDSGQDSMQAMSAIMLEPWLPANMPIPKLIKATTEQPLVRSISETSLKHSAYMQAEVQ